MKTLLLLFIPVCFLLAWKPASCCSIQSVCSIPALIHGQSITDTGNLFPDVINKTSHGKTEKTGSSVFRNIADDLGTLILTEEFLILVFALIMTVGGIIARRINRKFPSVTPYETPEEKMLAQKKPPRTILIGENIGKAETPVTKNTSPSTEKSFFDRINEKYPSVTPYETREENDPIQDRMKGK